MLMDPEFDAEESVPSLQDSIIKEPWEDILDDRVDSVLTEEAQDLEKDNLAPPLLDQEESSSQSEDQDHYQDVPAVDFGRPKVDEEVGELVLNGALHLTAPGATDEHMDDSSEDSLELEDLEAKFLQLDVTDQPSNGSSGQNGLLKDARGSLDDPYKADEQSYTEHVRRALTTEEERVSQLAAERDIGVFLTPPAPWLDPEQSRQRQSDDDIASTSLVVVSDAKLGDDLFYEDYLTELDEDVRPSNSAGDDGLFSGGSDMQIEDVLRWTELGDFTPVDFSNGLKLKSTLLAASLRAQNASQPSLLTSDDWERMIAVVYHNGEAFFVARDVDYAVEDGMIKLAVDLPEHERTLLGDDEATSHRVLREQLGKFEEK
ncbi:hypothetical protein M427DRAFT_36962 [Gonapodya prolifera JEL478]|uniref:Uncharacterized protein n=1 Tax=Gonapodya prolifera (strain JEL478) TaxID=1344416 RepID=A0A139A1F1_GONPJ|nr:hypothetical protein M427DRAFT_36962 [Gonapodya prolifera JEL478]|eukprot:KXS10582.1 hypothetical protein M427DRAFT_36962 [Gonapodya prolifera JEL478]